MPLQRALRQFDLEHVPFYSISHMNCASSIAALQWLERISLTQPEIGHVLLVCADQFNFCHQNGDISANQRYWVTLL